MISRKSRILGISGSPRRGGNTDTLLDEMLRGAKSAGAICQKIALKDIDFKGCVSCGSCSDVARICKIADGMRPIFKKIQEADSLVVASPIYFGSITGQLKTMIDRFECFWAARCIFNKPMRTKSGSRGVFICVAGQNKKIYFTNAKQIIKYFFNTIDMVYYDELLLTGIVDKADVLKRSGAMKKAFSMGVKLVRA